MRRPTAGSSSRSGGLSWLSQPGTLALVRPVTTSNRLPVSKSTNPVSHGSRRQDLLGRVRHATPRRPPRQPYSPATDAVDRSRAVSPMRARQRVVSRARAGTCAVAGVNEDRAHHSVSQRNARLITRSRAGRPNAGQSLTVEARRDFTRAENTPQPGHGASARAGVTSTTSSPSTAASSTRYSSSPTMTLAKPRRRAP